MLEVNKIYQGDCLEVMEEIDDKSIHCIIADLPYQMTSCHWDTIIPFEPLWAHYKRIIRDNGAIVLTGSQPFTSKLVMSNLEWFKYEWIWEKAKSPGFAHAKNAPIKQHENIIVFSPGAVNHKSLSGDSRMEYNPIMREGSPYRKKIQTPNMGGKTSVFHKPTKSQIDYVGTIYTNKGTRYPTSILKIKYGNQDRLHPTQKPDALYEYLIKTYTDEGDLVLDNAAGSCTLARAAIKTNRRWICIEQEEKYCKLGQESIDKITHIQKELFQ